MSSNRPIIVAYDISNDKIRRKVFKIIKCWRIDGQKSVHECRLTQGQAEELFLQINDPLDQKTDRLLMVWLEQHRKVLTRGVARNLIHRKLRFGGESWIENVGI